MNKRTYPIAEEKVSSEEIFDLVFKETSVKYGLQEFPKEILKQIKAFKKQDGKFYVSCLKRNKDIFIYDPNKKSGKDNSGEYVYINKEGRRIKSEGGIFEAH